MGPNAFPRASFLRLFSNIYLVKYLDKVVFGGLLPQG